MMLSPEENLNEISEKDFDPMNDDFNDSTFNSYKSGPGSYISPSLHTQKRWEDKKPNCKLYVSCIPVGINKCGFENIFLNFGTTFHCYLATANNSKTKWGFVEYKTIREASRAIYCVNNVPPLNLKVQFAISDDAKKNRSNIFESPANTLQEISQANTTFGTIPNETEDGNDIKIQPFQGILPQDMPTLYKWYTPYMSTYAQPIISHPNGEFSIYIGDEILDIFNEAMSFVKPVLKDNQRYLIYMGRGYAIKETIHHCERYGYSKNKVYSFSNESTVSTYESQPCCLCGQQAMRICFNCCYWYCSKTCFRSDQPNHVVNISGFVVCYNVAVTKKSRCNSKDVQNVNRGVFVKNLIFPPANDEVRERINKMNSASINFKEEPDNIVGNRNSYLKQTHFIRNINISYISNKGLPQADSTEVELELKDVKSCCDNSSLLPEDCILTPYCFTKVKISIAIDGFSYWVIKTSDMCEMFDITKSLFHFCQSSKSERLSDIRPSTKCAAFIEGFWYRAMIMSNQNSIVKILLVDIGREAECVLDKLKSLPEDKFSRPPIAFKIRFADGTSSYHQNLTDEDEISVKPVNVENDTLIVQVENEIYVNISSMNSINSSCDNVPTVNEMESPLPFNCYTVVLVSHVISRNEYYVNLCSIWEELKEMSEVLNEIGGKKSQVVNPVLDSVYIRCYQDVWCRAKVTNLMPLTLFYIDYGNEEIIQDYNGELKILPTFMLTTRIPDMALKIKVADGTSEQILSTIKPSTQLSIKPIAKDGDAFVVVFENESCSESEGCDKIPQVHIDTAVNEGHINHLLFATESCKHFYIIVQQVMSKNRICGSLNLNPCLKHLTTENIEEEILKLSPHLCGITNLGDKVACLTRDGICARGYITSIINETKRVALIDLGYVAVADKLVEVPESMRGVTEAAISCKFIQPQNDIQIGTKVRCHKAKLIGNEIHCEMEGYGPCVLSVWSPRIEDGGLASVRIMSGSRVLISSYRTPQAIYVQSFESKNRNLFETVIQDVAEFASTAPTLDRDPEIGEVLACLYPEDQNFYRAQVFRKRDKLFSVVYLDFGNAYDISSKDMRVLCDRLKMVPCCAVKIGLKGVHDQIFSARAVNFLNLNCTSDSNFLFLEYEDDLKNSILKTKEGLSLNTKLNDLISPNWKKCLEEAKDPTNGEVFFGDDVKYLTWDAGWKTKLFIVMQHTPNSCLVINIQDGFLEFMRDWFTPRISEYCDSFENLYQYTPRVHEICIVKMQDDGQWFRAVCTKVFDVSCWVVLIDFGNSGEVLLRNVRPMTDEFIQFPSVLKRCCIYGLPDEYPNEEAEKKLKKILRQGTTHDVTIIKEESKGVANTYFHQIAEISKQIGLLPISLPKLS